jgi:RND superfamily putative drug exporter
MRILLKLRWFFLLFWIVLLAVLLGFQPSMEQLVRDKGGITVPKGYSSVNAKEILQRHNSEEKNSISAVLVFHDKQGISEQDKAEINKVLNTLKDEKEKLGITEITTYLDSEEVKKQVVSEDNKTILTPISIEPKKRTAGEVREELQKAIGKTKVEHYLTGESFIGEDVVVSSQNGLHKTEKITVVFILLVLVLVFRSAIAPLIPLITVGISYAASAAIVAYLVKWFNFPLSNFTQIFMVAVLFGIGTDYCILLLSRFKEELPRHETVMEAIIRTYQTAGRTVFFSALAVLIGFASIGLSQFSLYRSATGVAIGIAVLLVAFVTIVPFFMAVLGPRLFWPTKSVGGHGESKMWGALGQFSLSKPFRALLFVAIIVVPLLVSYNGKLSFNSLSEIGESYESVKGFNTIADSFGPGEVMPVQVVIESEKNLDSAEGLAAIEKVSRELAGISAVDKVRSATRPLGEPVKEFTVADQAKTLQDGLGEGANGINQIGDGLDQAKVSLASSEPQLDAAVTGIGNLADGTKELRDGFTQIQDALSQLESGMRDGSIGAGKLREGLAQIQAQIQQSSGSTAQMIEEYNKLASGLQNLSNGYTGIEGGLEQLSVGLNAVLKEDIGFAALERNPDYASFVTDPNYEMIKKAVMGTTQGTESLIINLKQLNQGISAAAAGVSAGSQQMEQAAEGQKALLAGLAELEKGAAALETGIGQAADGQGQVVSKLPEFSNGLSQIENGQRQAQKGFTAMASQLESLTDGLGQSVEGLQEVSKGLGSAQDYLGKLTNNTDPEMSGFYVPSEALESSDFQQVFDRYLSTDKKVAKFEVVLKHNPYSDQALRASREVKTTVERAIARTELKGANYGVSGMSASSSDMLAASDKDYSQTVIYMIIGVSIILIILLRSIVMPLYLVVSLLLCFYSSLAINEVIFVDILGYDGINWTMPFFGFVLLMALGVDYSIFLMDRFNEYKEMPVGEAILTAMRNMGTVIFSAVIILGGTFAAMYPAGVLSLAQIATIVLAGLVLYAFVFLPFFVPVMVKVFGRANWFPFDRNQEMRKNKNQDISG